MLFAVLDKTDKRVNIENYIVQENRQFLYSLKKTETFEKTKNKNSGMSAKDILSINFN